MIFALFATIKRVFVSALKAEGKCVEDINVELYRSSALLLASYRLTGETLLSIRLPRSLVLAAIFRNSSNNIVTESLLPSRLISVKRGMGLFVGSVGDDGSAD